jgi:hypothetical protein
MKRNDLNWIITLKLDSVNGGEIQISNIEIEVPKNDFENGTCHMRRRFILLTFTFGERVK